MRRRLLAGASPWPCRHRPDCSTSAAPLFWIPTSLDTSALTVTRTMSDNFLHYTLPCLGLWSNCHPSLPHLHHHSSLSMTRRMRLAWHSGKSEEGRISSSFCGFAT
eukprot:2525061-Pyramimonas_sp.AAC.1